MYCPNCENSRLKVVDSVFTKEPYACYRRLKCKVCNESFFSYEELVIDPKKITRVKSNLTIAKQDKYKKKR